MIQTDRDTGREEAGVRSELVFQHTYGIIAPQNDINGTTRLLIPGVFDCFTLSLHDPEANVGMAANVDDITELITIFPDIVNNLQELGGKAFRLRTTNINAPSIDLIREAIKRSHLKFEDPILLGQQIRLNKQIVGMMQGYLEQGGIYDPTDETPGLDLGSSLNTYLDAVTGLTSADISLHLTPTQDAEMNRRNLGIKRDRNGILIDRKPYTPSYLPRT